MWITQIYCIAESRAELQLLLTSSVSTTRTLKKAHKIIVDSIFKKKNYIINE